MSKSPELFPLLRYPLDWSALTVEKLPALIDEGLALAKERLSILETMPEKEATYANFVAALVDFSLELDRAWSVAGHLSSVADGPAIRALMEKYLPIVSEFYAGVAVNEAVWTRVKHAQKTAHGLNALQQRHLKLTVRGFRRSGAELKPKEKAEFVAIEKELSTLGETFSKKIIDATNAFERHFPEGAEEGLLRGLPPTALAMGRAAAKAKGKDGFIFNLQAPSFSAILTYAQDCELRREFTLEGQKLARAEPFKTEALIRRMLTLRQRTAQLLRYKDFAAYTVEDRMLNRPAKINAFIRTLTRHTQKSAMRDFEKLARVLTEALNDFIEGIYLHGFNRSNTHVSKALDFITQNYTKPLTLNDIAREVGLSSYRLAHVVKAHTGKTVLQIIAHARIQNAQHLLEHSGKSCTEIAYEVGFNDQSYFIKHFRRLTGITPARYRRTRMVRPRDA